MNKNLKTVGKFLKNVGYGFVNPGSAFKKMATDDMRDPDFDMAEFAGQTVGCLLFGGAIGSILGNLIGANYQIDVVNDAWNRGDIAIRSRVTDHWFTNNNEFIIHDAENLGPASPDNFAPDDGDVKIYNF